MKTRPERPPLIGANGKDGACEAKKEIGVRQSSEVENKVSFMENCFKLLPRQALHAKTLGFEHPTSKEWKSFSTDLPEDMEHCIEKWRAYAKHQDF